MTRRLSREAWVWLVLLAATLLNWGLMELGPITGIGRVGWLSAAILVIAFTKSWLVIDNFMEVRDAPRLLRLALAGWAAVACGTLLVQLFA